MCAARCRSSGKTLAEREKKKAGTGLRHTPTCRRRAALRVAHVLAQQRPQLRVGAGEQEAEAGARQAAPVLREQARRDGEALDVERLVALWGVSESVSVGRGVRGQDLLRRS